MSWASGSTRGSLVTVAKGNRCRGALEPTIRVLNPKIDYTAIGTLDVSVLLYQGNVGS